MAIGVKFKEVIEELPNVDDGDVLERATTNRALRMALEMARPRNWWGLALPPVRLLDIAEREGIPLAWVPRAELVRELADAPDSQSRRHIVLSHRDALIDDVDEVLDECTDRWLEDDTELARKAVAAFRAGHHEAAMALAVALGEPLAAWASTPRVTSFESMAERREWERKRKDDRSYQWARTELAALRADLRSLDVKRAILIAPIPRFFTPWRPEWDTPAPSELSRHVVAHQPTPSHMGMENSVIALLLVASILRDMEEWSREVRAMDEP